MKVQHTLLILMITACSQTLDYKSETYINAVEHFENGNYDSTKILFIEASKQYQLPDTALNYLAYSYQLLNEPDSAIFYWKKSVAHNPEFELGYYNLGLMYDYKGDQESALKNYDIAISLDSESKKPLYNKAAILFGRNELNKSLNLCKMAVNIDSNYVLPYYLMTQIYFAFGFPDSSRLTGEKLVELEPDNPEYLFYLAGAESDLGNKERALELYSNSIELSPTNNPSYFNRATLYQGIRKFDLAKRDYRTTLKSEPNQVECHVRLSWIYKEENQLDSMRTELETSIKIDSTYSDAYLYLGDYYERTSQKSRACELYQKAVELNNQRATQRLNGCKSELEKSS